MSTLSHSLLGDSAPSGKATILSCLLNLSSTCMDTGLLSLPFAFAQSGVTLLSQATTRGTWRLAASLGLIVRMAIPPSHVRAAA